MRTTIVIIGTVFAFDYTLKNSSLTFVELLFLIMMVFFIMGGIYLMMQEEEENE